MAAFEFLAAAFFLSMLLAMATLLCVIIRPSFYVRQRSRFLALTGSWFGLYAIFILCFTGPTDEELKAAPTCESSPYKLPWKAGVTRFVAQGNRSFVSHRGFHTYAWDFVMPIGTEILAARDGQVVEVEDSLDGIGMAANFLTIQHEDGTRAAFAHIQKGGALAKVGDSVKQGQAVALSGMVGQTLFPHVHFYVIGADGTSSTLISFRDVPSGVPLAGHFYTSGNESISR